LGTGADISSLADPIFFGIIVATALWGITILQMWTYVNNNRDHWVVRAMVFILFGLDTATTALMTEMGHFYLISNFGSIMNLANLPKSGIAEVAINVIAVFAVELFFASRVYLLTGRKFLLPIIISVFALGAAIAGVFIVVDISRTPMVSHLASTSMKWEVALTNSLSAVSDIVATAAMSWELYNHKGGVKVTNSLLEKLLAYLVARGGLVTVAQIATLILYVVEPTSLNWMPVHFCLCKLYIITMVVILNSRDSLRNQNKSFLVSSSNMFTDSTTGQNMTTRSAHVIDTPVYELGNRDMKPGAGGIQITRDQITHYEGK
jgi:hypothetical protein